ncbi:MAG: ABC transporter substrate-binding protein [Thermomicrobiales bacterium]
MSSIVPGSHLRVAIPFDAESFNEIWRNYTGAGGYFVANNIYSRLVVQDVFGNKGVGPDLAERWDVSDDGITYTIHLNPSAKWEDGVPLTAEDVAYTYRTVLDNAYHGLTWIQDIDEIRALDDHTLEIKLKQPNAGFLGLLGSFVFSHIIAKHLYEGTDWETNPHNWEPIGSGPFKFDKWIKGDRIELVGNPDYWGEGPYLERLTYYVMSKEDAEKGIENGDIHFSIYGIPAADIDQWRAKPGVDVLAESGNSIGFMAFNWTQDRFQDRRVREAFARAVNRPAIAEAIYPPLKTPQHYYLEKIDWAFNPDAKAPDYDLDTAAELLDDAGYTADENGKRMSLRIAARALYPHYTIAAETIAKELAKLGIEATVETLTPVEWVEQVQKAGDFDLAMEAGDIGPDPDQLSSFLASDGPRNIMRYKNDVVDECLKAGKSVFDTEERGKHYKRLQSALAADIARVPLIQYGEYLPYRTEFTGWSWSDGVRGTVPFWYAGKIRPSGK